MTKEKTQLPQPDLGTCDMAGCERKATSWVGQSSSAACSEHIGKLIEEYQRYMDAE